jgi:hypothetical protein
VTYVSYMYLGTSKGISLDNWDICYSRPPRVDLMI